MPKGTSAPGNVSTWPTTVPPLPVPTNGLTRAAGSVTGAGLAPLPLPRAACAAAGVRARAIRAAQADTARVLQPRRSIGRLRVWAAGGASGAGLGADNDVKSMRNERTV